MWRFSNAFDTQKCSDNAEILLSLHQFINNVNLFLKLYFQNRNENVSCCPIIFLLYYRFFRYNLRFDTVASHHFRLHSLNILNTPVQFLFLLRVFYQLCLYSIFILYIFCNGTSWVSVSNFWSISRSWVNSYGSDIFLKYWGCEKIWTKSLWVK